MSNLAIKVETISKAYQLGQIGTGTISRDIERFFITKILGKEDPFLKIGQTNDRTQKGTSDIVWSLKDINFEIEQGDAVGIIGRNGAGKSTLLKVLSRVTSPTTGHVKVKGRIASLLEVGTGFHPELTGRENIYLNGAILGMRKKEIKRKFDEIVDFSGVERYIDTPVKRYSSGMYVRLAFAVAAHLESEILIVDEVLAVGDAEFQKKCLGKMNSLSKGEGRTLLFVSHNMAAVSSLCKKGIMLEMGQVKQYGLVDEVVNNYFQSSKLTEAISVSYNEHKTRFTGKDVVLQKACVESENLYALDSEVHLVFEYELIKDFENFNLSLVLYDNLNVPIFNTLSSVVNLTKGKYSSTLILPAHFLNSISYSVRLLLVSNSKALLDIEDLVSWKAVEITNREHSWHGNFIGSIRPKLDWELIKL